MSALYRRAGVLALGTGGYVYLYHRKHLPERVLALQTNDGPQVLTTEICPPSNIIEGRAKVPVESAKSGPLVLQLQQVQVIFRHGARTPIHTIPKLPEVEYYPDYFCRCHDASMFPCERVSLVDGREPAWSDCDTDLARTPLRVSASCFLTDENVQACQQELYFEKKIMIGNRIGRQS
ncbi:hypothetical protein PoB_006825800 [Plakobranchus ocellatus]|uniref:Uncharacterized protein n=1 Tax=Plakobranchus ocellatus TaxID=259542 RepID=A0AAV4DCG0_9GAST|nr:hypothetical protein PoB_006825800 [Plakobranchus ocellatus]